MSCLCFALQAEAKPFLAYFSLSLVHDKPFRIYRNDNIWAIITGIGKERMARAISFFAGFSFPDPISYLNIGLAGHKDEEIGNVFLCHKVMDESRQISLYPTFFFPWKKRTETLCTIDRMESNYPAPYLFDQEGSAFFTTAKSFTELEKVQLLKVVSDNINNPLSTFEKEKVPSLMERAIPDTKELLSYLCSKQSM